MALFGTSEEKHARRTAQIEAKNRELDHQEALRSHFSLIAEQVGARDKLMAAERARSAPKWEYLVIDDLESDKFDTLGAVGWELVNINSYATGGGIGGNSMMKVHFRTIFKRPLLQEYSDEVHALELEIAKLRSQKPE